jgi:hypothetical protein
MPVILNREAAENVGRLDKAVYLTYLNHNEGTSLRAVIIHHVFAMVLGSRICRSKVWAYISYCPYHCRGLYMNETEKKSVPRKGIVFALGISCIILVACLGVAITTYTLAINDKNDQISQLNSGVNSTFGLLFSYFSNLQNQSNSVLNTTGATFVIINQINLDPAKWENKTVIVIGKLYGPYPYFTAISYYYVLSLNETATSQTGLDVNSIGVDFTNDGIQWSGSTVLIVGVVEKGIIGTIVQGAQPTTIYYIKEQAVLTS